MVVRLRKVDNLLRLSGLSLVVLHARLLAVKDLLDLVALAEGDRACRLLLAKLPLLPARTLRILIIYMQRFHDIFSAASINLDFSMFLLRISTRLIGHQFVLAIADDFSGAFNLSLRYLSAIISWLLHGTWTLRVTFDIDELLVILEVWLQIETFFSVYVVSEGAIA